MPAQSPDTDHLVTAARQWWDAGYSVVPSHEDGSKRPYGPWKAYQEQRMAWDDLEQLLRTGNYTGIGAIMGTSSGNTELIEIEGPGTVAQARLARLVEVATSLGLLDLFTRIINGCAVKSAGDGLHLFIRITDGPAKPNTKLATTRDHKVIAETRGEGGFVIVAPTPGRKGHKAGNLYTFIGPATPANTPNVTSAERDQLHTLFTAALHEADPQPQPTTPRQPATPTEGLTPWDDYANRTTWTDILQPHGWQYVYTAPDGRIHWTRPGKPIHDGTSATSIEDGPLYVFTTSTAFPANEGISKQYAYAILTHGGDMKAAARALNDAGYGDQVPPPPELNDWQPDRASTDDEAPQPTAYELEVIRKYSELRVLEDARHMLAANKLGQAPALNAINLATFLQQPDEDARYRIDGLWPLEGRVLLSAAAKSGKTTMVAANLIPALVDNRPFLGHHTPAPADNIVLFNMEVGPNALRRWMRDAGIHNTDRVHVANLRGKATALTLNTEQGRKLLATWLRDHGCDVAILDPLAPLLAALGLDENSNTDIATFFAWWSETLGLAGVHDDLVVHHTGHAGQRSRGASRLLDEPDAIWTLTKDTEDDDDSEFASLDAPTRYLTAYGRDVELPTQALAFDYATRALTLTGKGRAEAKGGRIESKVIRLMRDGKLRTKNRICTELGGDRNTVYRAIVSLLASDRLIETEIYESGKPKLGLNEAP